MDPKIVDDDWAGVQDEGIAQTAGRGGEGNGQERDVEPEIAPGHGTPWWLYAGLLLVAAQLAVESRRIDAQHLGSTGLVAAFRLKHVHDVGPLAYVERWISVGPRRNERLLLPFGGPLREGRRLDDVGLAQYPGRLQCVLQLPDITGPFVDHHGIECVRRERL